MNALLRLALCAGALSLAWAGLRAVDPQCGPALLSLPSLQDYLESEEEREARLTEIGERLQERVEAKCRLVEELLAGRVSLRQAADRFRVLDEGAADFNWMAFHLMYPNMSPEEAHCREVITAVEALSRDTCEAAAAVERLERVLEEYQQNGLVPSRG